MKVYLPISHGNVSYIKLETFGATTSFIVDVTKIRYELGAGLNAERCTQVCSELVEKVSNFLYWMSEIGKKVYKICESYWL